MRFGFGISFVRNPFVFLWLTILFQLVFQLVWVVYVAPRLSPLRKLPLASQGPWWKTFLVEPGPEDLERFMNETANDGLIRFFGVFHGERILVTKSHGTKEMMLLQAYNYDKIPIATKIIGQLTGLGLVVAGQDEHKVCQGFPTLSCLSCSRTLYSVNGNLYCPHSSTNTSKTYSLDSGCTPSSWSPRSRRR